MISFRGSFNPFLQQSIITSSEMSTTLNLWSMKCAPYHSNTVCFYAVRCILSGCWMRLTEQNTSSAETPRGVCNRHTLACFPYQNGSWTLTDTPCELYGWFVARWGSKHCTCHCHSLCGAKGKHFAIKHTYYLWPVGSIGCSQLCGF